MSTYKLDSNHNPLNLVAQNLGVFVVDNAKVKRAEKGQLDCWWGITNARTGVGVWVWIEFKTPGGKLKPEQLENLEWCRQKGLPAEVIRTEGDVLKAYERYGGELA